MARAKGLETVVIELNPLTNFDDVLRGLGNRTRTGIVVLTTPGFVVIAPKFAAAAQKYRIPTISSLKTYLRAGVLMTYGPVQDLYFARAVVLADKILRGEPVCNLLNKP